MFRIDIVTDNMDQSTRIMHSSDPVCELLIMVYVLKLRLFAWASGLEQQ
jgi:hypothetical protein